MNEGLILDDVVRTEVNLPYEISFRTYFPEGYELSDEKFPIVLQKSPNEKSHLK